MKSLLITILSLNLLLLSSCSTAIFSRETECYKKVNKYAKKHWIYKGEEGTDEKIILENKGINALAFQNEKLDNCLYTLEKKQIITIFGPPHKIEKFSDRKIQMFYMSTFGCQEFYPDGTFKSKNCNFYIFVFENNRCIEFSVGGVSISH